MPVFFHAQSHLWIAYLFLFNGWLLCLFLRARSQGFCKLTKPFEAQIVGGFLLSIAINGACLLVLQKLTLPFATMGYLLPVISLSLMAACLLSGLRPHGFVDFEIGLSRILLYGFVFLVLFYNGGLIEHMTDAWWHMSLANKIGIEGSFAPDRGHLTGLPTRYYPPLWHGNLALAQILSGEMLPILWNTFTAWGAMFKVMAFYLFAHALTRNSVIALMAAFLFVMLPGIGNSYLRVSAWPSHIGYTAWFCLFYVCFCFLDGTRNSLTRYGVLQWITLDRISLLIAAFVLAVIIYFSHKAELFYFALSILFYFFALVFAQVLRGKEAEPVEPAEPLIALAGLLIVAIGLYFSLEFALAGFGADQSGRSNLDLIIVAWLPVVVLGSMALLWIGRFKIPTWCARLCFALLLCGLFLLVDYRHVASLFDPSLAYPMGASRQYALIASGWFDAPLKVPGWHLQLREGLLFSGVIALPLSFVLAFIKPSRETLFLASCCFLSLLVCSSPYLYHWLTQVLDYHSVWRIALLVFHPIIYAVFIDYLVNVIKEAR